MIDWRDYLRDQKKVVDSAKEPLTDQHILPARRRLLFEARGALRQHLEQQLLDAIQRFEDETPPSGKDVLY